MNVLVSNFSWVLLRWPLGNLARDLVIKTTMGHTGKTTTARICYCSFRRFSEENWVSWLGHMGHIAHIGTLGTTVERPHWPHMNWYEFNNLNIPWTFLVDVDHRSATSQAEDLRALATSPTSILCGGVWFVWCFLYFFAVPCFWSCLSMSHNNGNND